jgi:hypothetical protein
VETLEDRVVPSVTLGSQFAQHSYIGDSPMLWIMGSDSYSNPLSYSIAGAPTGLGINSSSGNMTGTIASNANTTSPYSVTVTATDTITSEYATTSFSWYVAGVPTITNPGAQESMCGDPISMQISASGGASALSYSAMMGLPTGLSLNSSTGVISGTVSSSASTSSPYYVSVSVTDGTRSASQSFNWTISQAYVVLVQGDQDNVAGETVSVDLYSWNAPDHTLSFSATGLPSGLSINSGTGTVSGTISYGAASSSPHFVTITACDSAASISTDESFDWYVDTPEVTVLTPGDLESIVGASVELTAAAQSTDGATLSFSASGLPSGLSIDSGTGTISGTIASNADTNSPYSVTVTATNTGAEISNYVTFSWSVGLLVLRDPDAQANLVGETVNLSLTAPYASNATLAFSATGLPSGLTIGSSTGTISGTIASDADSDTAYSVTVTVTDGTLSASKTFAWEVHKLILQNPGSQYNLDSESVSVALTVSALSGHTVTYGALGLPAGLSINSSSGVISGTLAADADEDGPYSVTVTATDTTVSVCASKTFIWAISQPESLVAVNIPVPPDPDSQAGIIAGLQRQIARQEVIISQGQQYIPFIIQNIVENIALMAGPDPATALGEVNVWTNRLSRVLTIINRATLNRDRLENEVELYRLRLRVW